MTPLALSTRRPRTAASADTPMASERPRGARPSSASVDALASLERGTLVSHAGPLTPRCVHGLTPTEAVEVLGIAAREREAQVTRHLVVFEGRCVVCDVPRDPELVQCPPAAATIDDDTAADAADPGDARDRPRLR